MPVHMTQDQFAEFSASVGRAEPHGEVPSVGKPPRAKKDPAALPENQIEKQIVDFLRLRRWQVKKTHVGVFVPYYTVVKMFEAIVALFTKGEPLPPLRDFLPGGSVVRMSDKGEPDYHAWRGIGNGLTQNFFIEVKAAGKRPTAEQIEQLQALKLQGASAAEWFNDFDFGGPHSFLEFYRKTFVEEG